MKSPYEAAAHIGPACLELKRLAEKADLKLLAHLLDMASLQASKDQIATLPAVADQKPDNMVQLRIGRRMHARGGKAGDALR